MSTIRVGDIGTAFRLTITENSTAVDLSGATATSIILKHLPRGIPKSFASTWVTDGTNGQMQYTSSDAGVIDRIGLWLIQGRIEGLSSWTGRTSSTTFFAEPALSTST